MGIFIYCLIIFISILGHELGHFYVAYKQDVITEELAIGMGPKLFSKEIKNIIFSLRLFPIGGYCRFDENTLNNCSVKSKKKIFMAGVEINAILTLIAILIYLRLPEFGIKYISIKSNSTNLIDTLVFFNNLYLTYSFKDLIAYYINTFATINIAIAIINILPIPSLDGGRLVSLKAVEKKILTEKNESIMNTIFSCAIFVISIGLLVSDVLKYFFK